MYKKAWCTCKVVDFVTFWLPSPSLDLKVPITVLHGAWNRIGQSQKSGFDSQSSLNFLRFFFSRLGCLFYCEDHFHYHSMITTMWALKMRLMTPPPRGVLPYRIYKPYGYVSPHRVGFLRCFGLKTGTHFVHFGRESGIVFKWTTGVYERIYRFNSRWVSKKERRMCEFEMDLTNFLFAL